MNKIVYIRAIEQGENASGQMYIKLVAQNTDGIAPFYINKEDVIFPEDICIDKKKPEHEHDYFLASTTPGFDRTIGACAHYPGKKQYYTLATLVCRKCGTTKQIELDVH